MSTQVLSPKAGTTADKVLSKQTYDSCDTIKAKMFSDDGRKGWKAMVQPTHLKGVTIQRLWSDVFADGSDFLERYHDSRRETDLKVGSWNYASDMGSGYRFVSLVTLVDVPRAHTPTPLNEAHRFAFLTTADDDDGKLLMTYQISSQTPNVPAGGSFRTEAYCEISADSSTSDCTIAFWGNCRKMSFAFSAIQYIATPRAIREMSAAYQLMVDMIRAEATDKPALVKDDAIIIADRRLEVGCGGEEEEGSDALSKEATDATTTTLAVATTPSASEDVFRVGDPATSASDTFLMVPSPVPTPMELASESSMSSPVTAAAATTRTTLPPSEISPAGPLSTAASLLSAQAYPAGLAIAHDMFTLLPKKSRKVVLNPTPLQSLTIARLWAAVFATGSPFLRRYHEWRSQLVVDCGAWRLAADGASGFRTLELAAAVSAHGARTTTTTLTRLTQAHRFSYVRDAQGRLLLTYQISSQTPDLPGGDTFRSEAHMEVTAEDEDADCTVSVWGNSVAVVVDTTASEPSAFAAIQTAVESRALRELRATYRLMLAMVQDDIYREELPTYLATRVAGTDSDSAKAAATSSRLTQPCSVM